MNELLHSTPSLETKEPSPEYTPSFSESIKLEPLPIENFELTEDEQAWWSAYISAQEALMELTPEQHVYADFLAEKQGLKMIQEVRDFKSTPEAVSPGVIYLDTTYDIAAVTAGSKPAALLTHSQLGTIGQRLITIGQESGLDVANITTYAGPSIIFGTAAAVQTITDLYDTYLADNRFPDALFDETLGRALGYPEEAISQYVARRTEIGRYDEFAAKKFEVVN
ncbi:MAG TPA: hypothetical protein VGE59_03290 [Patescibacteria group bacterium]